MPLKVLELGEGVGGQAGGMFTAARPPNTEHDTNTGLPHTNAYVSFVCAVMNA